MNEFTRSVIIFVAVMALFGGGFSQAGTQEKKNTQTAGVDNTRMGAYKADATIHVGPNVLVSGSNGHLKHDELLACSDLSHANLLMVGSIVDDLDEFNPRVVAYVSFDGGKSWSPGIVTPSGHKGNDPACAYGQNGEVYFVTTDRPAGIDFYASPDGGHTWRPPVAMIGGGWDRPYVTVDGTGGKYGGRVYITANGGNILNVAWNKERPLSTASPRKMGGVNLYRSLDRGGIFLGPVESMGVSEGRAQPLWNMNSVVLSDGTLVSLVGLPDQESEKRKHIPLKVMFSLDGGESFSEAVGIREYSTDCSVAEYYRETLPNLAIDQGSPVLKDRLYLAWNECKQNSQGQPMGEVSFVSYSSDKGKNWSPPVRVDNQPADAEEHHAQYQTTVAVNKDGVVGVMWYEGFEDARSAGYRVRFTASLDGGETWLPSVSLSQAPNLIGGAERWSLGASASGGNGSAPLKLSVGPAIWEASGHTGGLTADAEGVFHAFWVDNRTGIKQVWTAPVQVSGAVLRNGDKDLAGLDDVSSRLKIHFTGINLDKSTGLLSATIHLKNTSEQAIRGPLKMRILRVNSEFGKSEVTNSENGLIGSGAILKLSDLSERDSLKPNDEIVAPLRFKIDNLGPIRSEGKWHGPLLGLEGRIFGKIEQ